MQSALFRRNRPFLLSAVLIGGALEWFELFLFIHWSEVFSKLFFQDAEVFTTFNILFVFFIGVLGRPVGAILFGDIGDRFGRKIAFTSSIALMVIPSFLIAGIGWILPGTGIAVAVILSILRFIQGMSVGAELPGAMCYLAEGIAKKEKAFICSFALVGPHIGILLSQVESFIIDKFFSQHFIETYGWRLSFALGGFLALLAVFFRNRMGESLEFSALKLKNCLSKNPVKDALTKHWKKLLNCFFSLFVSVVVFFMYTIFIEIYLSGFWETNKTKSFIIGLIITTMHTITLPLWGWVGDRYPLRRLLILSTLGILVASALLFFNNAITIVAILAFIILIGLNIQAALMPCYIVGLFPTAIRYTGIAIGFSVCDSLVGGAIPWLGGLLAHKVGIKESFIIATFISAVVSLVTFLITKDEDHVYS